MKLEAVQDRWGVDHGLGLAGPARQLANIRTLQQVEPGKYLRGIDGSGEMLSARHLPPSRDVIFDRPGMELGSLARHESDLVRYYSGTTPPD